MLFLFSSTYSYPLLSLTITKITVMSCCLVMSAFTQMYCCYLGCLELCFLYSLLSLFILAPCCRWTRVLVFVFGLI